MPDSLHWIQRKYQIQFLTPAFLGGADQSGQWRTPPFKALLRQWWRVAYAARKNFQVDIMAMREEEGRLFGNAWLERQSGREKESAASRSLVRLRLSSWREGAMAQWPRFDQGVVQHPEVQIPSRNQREPSDRISSHLYLGFGPLAAAGEQARLPNGKKAVACGESADLALAFKLDAGNGAGAENLILDSLRLMDLFGTVGGRSRNGWGSFRLVPADGRWPTITLPLRDWQQALALDWPHCIGRDDRGALIWRTAKEYADWKELMRDLACIKIAIRTQFEWRNNSPDQRHWLSYPVTNHQVRSWNDLNLRLPNSLRFKIRCMNGDPRRLIGVIYHMPCSPPPSFDPQRGILVGVWQQVHHLLDELCKPAHQRRLPQTLDQRVIQQIAGATLQRSQE